MENNECSPEEKEYKKERETAKARASPHPSKARVTQRTLPQEYDDLREVFSNRFSTDYQGLNAFMVHYPYSLPLVRAALEQLREAQVFSMLDLCSAHSLVRIREGDEWKTAFHNMSGHYKYLVMPYGLSNAPRVFQAFINEIFKDLINNYVITYIDNILIYSTSYGNHIHHVRTVLTWLLQRNST
ncbi:hypothetical protein QTP70_013345 [Hemibagrus guttatus]|uniref:ribonuclease H n=1 Tax=Hemibagrus guttatus TaxID=175788 RepID=A0AAE0RC56_9TELE|nr:hypothetical protein QTP70_013345 [Hemibagrus guttatus]KAK3569686.1 hypothetical protein QTP86_002612 [Hemibagrus guttatus]